MAAETVPTSDAPASLLDDPLYRASLPYGVALDRCAFYLSQAEGLRGLLAGHPWYARELRSRMGSTLATDARGLTTQYAALAWVEPSNAQLVELGAQVCRAVRAQGRLVVLTSNALGRRLPEWRATALSPDPAGTGAVREWLRRNDFSLVEQVGVFPLQAIVLSRIYPQLAALGRDAWSDRVLQAMLARYVVRGWQARYTPVAVLLAQKDGS